MFEHGYWLKMGICVQICSANTWPLHAFSGPLMAIYSEKPGWATNENSCQKGPQLGFVPETFRLRGNNSSTNWTTVMPTINKCGTFGDAQHADTLLVIDADILQ